MNISFIDDKKITIEMIYQLNEAVEMPGSCTDEVISEIVNAPAQMHRRDSNDKIKKLEEKKKEGFHSMTAKLLYIMKRASETTIGYLCT